MLATRVPSISIRRCTRAAASFGTQSLPWSAVCCTCQWNHQGRTCHDQSIMKIYTSDLTFLACQTDVSLWFQLRRAWSFRVRTFMIFAIFVAAAHMPTHLPADTFTLAGRATINQLSSALNFERSLWSSESRCCFAFIVNAFNVTWSETWKSKIALQDKDSDVFQSSALVLHLDDSCNTANVALVRHVLLTLLGSISNESFLWYLSQASCSRLKNQSSYGILFKCGFFIQSPSNHQFDSILFFSPQE